MIDDGVCDPECNLFECKHNDCTIEEAIDKCLQEVPESLRSQDESLVLNLELNMSKLHMQGGSSDSENSQVYSHARPKEETPVQKEDVFSL